MVIELMGHKAGWLTLAAGLAGGADIILIPEIPYDLDSICRHLTERRRRGKWFSIVAVAEGAAPKETTQLEPALVAASAGKKKKKKKKAGKNESLVETPGTKNGVASESDPPDGPSGSAVARAIHRRL